MTEDRPIRRERRQRPARIEIDLVAQISIVSAVASVFAILFNYAYFAVLGFRYIQFFSVGDFIMFAIENLPHAAAVSGMAILIGFFPVIVDWIVRDLLGLAGPLWDRVHAWAIRIGLAASLGYAVWVFVAADVTGTNAAGDPTRFVHLFPVIGFAISLLYRRGLPPFQNVGFYIVSVLVMLSVFIYMMGADLARRAQDPGSIFVDVVEFADRETLQGNVLRALSTGVLFRNPAGETSFIPNDNVRSLRLRVRPGPPAAPTGDLVPDSGGTFTGDKPPNGG